MSRTLARWLVVCSFAFAPLSGYSATPMLAAYEDGTLYLNADGSVWGTGRITGYFPGATSPVRLLQLSGVVAVATGDSVDLAVLSDGSVWGTGYNYHGQLNGTPSAQTFTEPLQVQGLSGITHLVGQFHYLALKQDGTVWSWGQNGFGQLGDGTKTDRYVPAQIPGLTDVVKVAAGPQGSVALKSDGTVWVWGNTAQGAKGNGVFAPDETHPDGTTLSPSKVLNLDSVIAVAAGAGHFTALRGDGTVWTWGYGAHGENGPGNTESAVVYPTQVTGLTQVEAIAEGLFYVLALKADGSVWAWGNNSVGQLGASGISYSATPVQVPGVTGATAIAAGASHAAALRSDGTVLAWGQNGFGQLGDGTLTDRTTPALVVGPGGSGQLNLVQAAPASYNLLPTGWISLSPSAGSAPLTVQVSALDASDPDGSIAGYAWKTSDGQQASGSPASLVFSQAGTYDIDLIIEDNAGGRGTARQQVLVSPVTASGSAKPKINMAQRTGVALTDDGRVYTWGPYWNLGRYIDDQTLYALPTTNSVPMPTGATGAIDIALGPESTTMHVLLADGSVIGWGANESGQVGSGARDHVVNQPQPLGVLSGVQALATGAAHSLALTSDGRVFAWGGNSFGQLGVGDTENRFEPVQVSSLSNVTAIAASETISVALKSDGTVWAWGLNQWYNLGDRTQTNRATPVQIPGLSGVANIFTASGVIFARKSDGTFWVTGYLPFDSPVPGDPGPAEGARHLSLFDGATQIAGSWEHLIVLKSDGTVWTGGKASSHALGFDDGADVSGLKQVAGVSDAIFVAAGGKSSMVLRRDGTVYTWGENAYGELGNGTLAPSLTPVLVVNESANGPLDLIASVPNSVPQELIPPFFVATYSTGEISSTSLYADVRGIVTGTLAGEGRFAASYNVYVAGALPGGAYYQLDSGYNWSALTWPMAEFLLGAGLTNQDSVVRAQILQGADLSGLIGASVIVGYGTDPNEMLQSGRYRTIFTVTSP